MTGYPPFRLLVPLDYVSPGPNLQKGVTGCTVLIYLIRRLPR